MASLFWFHFGLFSGVSELPMCPGRKNGVYNTPEKQSRTVMDAYVGSVCSRSVSIVTTVDIISMYN